MAGPKPTEHFDRVQANTVDAAVFYQAGVPFAPLVDPITTAGDIIIGDATGTTVRLPAGADGTVLNIDPVTHLPAWVSDTDAGFAVPAFTLGTAAAAGAAATVVRSDATIVAFDVTVPTTSAVGDAAATGAAAVAARRDHVHGREAFAAPTIALGAAAAIGAAATPIRSDATIAAFDATVPVTQAFADAAATGAAAFAARRDHKHGMPAAPVTTLTGTAAQITVSAATGAVTLSIPNPHTVPNAPPASATQAALQVGGGAFDGVSAGFFTTGNAQGTAIGVNLPTGSTADLLNMQLAGAARLSVNSLGQIKPVNQILFQAHAMGVLFPGTQTFLAEGYKNSHSWSNVTGMTATGNDQLVLGNQAALDMAFSNWAANGFRFIANAQGGSNLQVLQIGATGILTLSNKLYPATDAAATQAACGIYAGTGAPSNANGANGDIYFRSDGGALTTVYQRRAGAWAGIV